MKFDFDAEALARMERHKAHLPDGKDLTLLVLKGHLLIEEGLDELISAACPEPQHIFGRRAPPFHVKVRIARALTGHVLYGGLWPMMDSLNTLRNDLAHNLDSPKLKNKVLAFMDERRKQMQVLSDPPTLPADRDIDSEQLRSDISMLIGQLTAWALGLRILVKKLEPWKAMVDEVNRK